MPSVISGDANVSATEFGFLDGVTSSLQSQIDSKLPLAGGKILQIVRATDATNRSTTSSTFVDASISVTITPQKSDSAILIIWSASITTPTSNNNAEFQITDASNNTLSGAENIVVNSSDASSIVTSLLVIGYSTPATTTATTYKVRFRANVGTTNIRNASTTGQLYAIEVSA